MSTVNTGGYTCDMRTVRAHLRNQGIDPEVVDSMLCAVLETVSATSNFAAELESNFRPCVLESKDHHHPEYYEAIVIGLGMWFQMLAQTGVLPKEVIARALESAELIHIEKSVVNKDGASA